MIFLFRFPRYFHVISKEIFITSAENRDWHRNKSNLAANLHYLWHFWQEENKIFLPCNTHFSSSFFFFNFSQQIFLLRFASFSPHPRWVNASNFYEIINFAAWKTMKNFLEMDRKARKMWCENATRAFEWWKSWWRLKNLKIFHSNCSENGEDWENYGKNRVAVAQRWPCHVLLHVLTKKISFSMNFQTALRSQFMRRRKILRVFLALVTWLWTFSSSSRDHFSLFEHRWLSQIFLRQGGTW